jgi:hypothetical protein
MKTAEKLVESAQHAVAASAPAPVDEADDADVADADEELAVDEGVTGDEVETEDADVADVDEGGTEDEVGPEDANVADETDAEESVTGDEDADETDDTDEE